MKQLSTLFLASIIASAASAQQASISVVRADGYALNALSISRNGAYICGATWDRDAFVTARDGNPFALMPDDEQGEATGSELRHVSDNGVAVGTNGELGVIFDIEGNRTDLTVPEGYKYFLTEDITADGSQIVGSLTRSWDVVAATKMIDDEEWTLLPVPEDDEIFEGAYAAKYVSGDGSVILGFAGNFGPAVLWYRQTDGSYTVDPIYVEFTDLYGDGSKPYVGFDPMAISANGKYALIYLQSTEGSFIGIYDTETKELNVIDEPQEAEMAEMGMWPTAIADDGTVVGIYGNMMMRYGTFILKGGQTQTTPMGEAFPEIAETMAVYDATGFNTPVGISADGRYIVGFGVYADLSDPEPVGDFQTYVIDTKPDESGISAPASADATGSETYYTPDGIRHTSPVKGLNIIRNSDGSTRKVIVK